MPSTPSTRPRRPDSQAARRLAATLLAAALGASACASRAGSPATAAAGAGTNDGFAPLFNGKDLSGWKIPEGDNGHWKVVDGVIDYDALSEAKPDKHLWTEKAYGDFVLRMDWRLKETRGEYGMLDILPDGSYRTGPDGKNVVTPRPNADSGVLLRGLPKAQVNIWCWPVGSGEIWGFRTDKEAPPETRAGAVPKLRADRPVGAWNTFEITAQGEVVTVVLNGQKVIDGVRLPGLPSHGPIGLQHHGGLKPDGTWSPASALVQFRNLSIRELTRKELTGAAPALP